MSLQKDGGQASENENIFIICKINKLELSPFFERTSPYSFMTIFRRFSN